MIQSFTEEFRLDSGVHVTVEWSWADGDVTIEGVFSRTGRDKVFLDVHETLRFEEQVLALEPFPPFASSTRKN